MQKIIRVKKKLLKKLEGVSKLLTGTVKVNKARKEMYWTLYAISHRTLKAQCTTEMKTNENEQEGYSSKDHSVLLDKHPCDAVVLFVLRGLQTSQGVCCVLNRLFGKQKEPVHMYMQNLNPIFQARHLNCPLGCIKHTWLYQAYSSETIKVPIKTNTIPIITI